jgi:site-specific DNA-cytosine methylase
MRARTLLWIIWCLSVRQFPAAFVENVAALLYIKQGKVWGALLAVIEGIGYTATVAEDDPVNHGIPHHRKRAFILILRKDLESEWGTLAAKFEVPEHTFTPIEDMLLPADDPAVVAEFAAFDIDLIDSGMH